MTSPVSYSSSEFDAAEVFAESLMNQINREDVRNMVQTQRDMLSRFEKTNEMLINFNILSANRCAATSQEFKKHTQLLYEMKRDLDVVFKRIRIIKDRLGKAYPDAFKACGNVTPLLEEDECEDEFSPSSSSSQSIAENQSHIVKEPATGNQPECDKKQTETAENQSADHCENKKEKDTDPSVGTGKKKVSKTPDLTHRKRVNSKTKSKQLTGHQS